MNIKNMDLTAALINIRMIIGFLIMGGGVVGNFIGKFDLVTMLVIITVGLIATETAIIQQKLKKIEMMR